MNEFETNQLVADQICQSGQWQGQQFSFGQYVALVDGQVVAVESEPLIALERLRDIVDDPARGMMFEVGPSVVDVIRLS